MIQPYYAFRSVDLLMSSSSLRRAITSDPITIIRHDFVMCVAFMSAKHPIQIFKRLHRSIAVFGFFCFVFQHVPCTCSLFLLLVLISYFFIFEKKILPNVHQSFRALIIIAIRNASHFVFIFTKYRKHYMVAPQNTKNI